MEGWKYLWRQQEEVEKAVLGGWKYELWDEYKFLEVVKDCKW